MTAVCTSVIYYQSTHINVMADEHASSNFFCMNGHTPTSHPLYSLLAKWSYSHRTDKASHYKQYFRTNFTASLKHSPA